MPRYGRVGASSEETQAIQDAITRATRGPTSLVTYPFGAPTDIVRNRQVSPHKATFGSYIRCDVIDNDVYLDAPEITYKDIGKSICVSNMTTSSGNAIYFVPAGKQTVEGFNSYFMLPCDGYATAILTAIDESNWIDANTTTSGIYDTLQHLYHDNVANEFTALPVVEKTTTTSGDVFLIEDSEDNYNKKYVYQENLGLGGGTLDRCLLFSDDTEFTTTGTSYTDKKTFRIIPDADKMPAYWRFIFTAWIEQATSGDTGYVKLQVGGDANEQVGITEESETVFWLDVPGSLEQVSAGYVLADVTISIRVQGSGGGTTHLKYTDMYGIYV